VVVVAWPHGVGRVDLQAATAQGTPVVITPGSGTRAVALRDLDCATIGIVGYGWIGRRVGELAAHSG
jgi:D-3-phosphoglycerate dehydrogenase / 2-oxoglutarate reductase